MPLPCPEQSLGQILEAAVSVGSRTLEVQLDTLVAALHMQVGILGTVGAQPCPCLPSSARHVLLGRGRGIPEGLAARGPRAAGGACPRP